MSHLQPKKSEMQVNRNIVGFHCGDEGGGGWRGRRGLKMETIKEINCFTLMGRECVVGVDSSGTVRKCFRWDSVLFKQRKKNHFAVYEF